MGNAGPPGNFILPVLSIFHRGCHPLNGFIVASVAINYLKLKFMILFLWSFIQIGYYFMFLKNFLNTSQYQKLLVGKKNDVYPTSNNFYILEPDK